MVKWEVEDLLEDEGVLEGAVEEEEGFGDVVVGRTWCCWFWDLEFFEHYVAAFGFLILRRLRFGGSCGGFWGFFVFVGEFCGE